MAYEFKKLSDVEMLPKVNNNDTMLVVDQNEVKQTPVPKADWNEMDTQSPTFIMNKPKSLGGYKYFYYSSYYLYPTDSIENVPTFSTINATTKEEFITSYNKQPLMIIDAINNSKTPVLFYCEISNALVYYQPYSYSTSEVVLAVRNPEWKM